MQILKENLPSTLSSFPVNYTFHKRTKTLRAKLVSESVEVTIPCGSILESHVFDFLNKVANWLLGKKHKILPLTRFQEGEKISIFGEVYEVKYIAGLSNRILLQEHQFLIVRIKPSVPILPLIQKFLKSILHEKVSAKSAEYAAALDVKISKVSVKKMTSRWGSCSSNGNLSYALNLVFAPLEMVDYVCAHEVAHLKYMDHSPNFWKCVGSIYPEYKKSRLWLRKNREPLFCYDL